jgi:hypothetical protein
MRKGGWLLALLLVLGCGEESTVVVEPAQPDIVVEHIYHTTYEEDTTPDVVVVDNYITETIVMEDNTPDVVQEFYSSAADLPVLLWNVGGEVPMPKKLRQRNGGVPITNIVADDALGVDQDSSGDSMFIEWKNFPLPTNHKNGLILSNDSGDAAHDINVTAGKARDATDVGNLALATEITKQIDAAWAVGDDAGGLDTGTVAADTMYAVWLIKRVDTDVVDVLLSASFTAPTMPTNYTLKRLIGAILTDGGSDVWQFKQDGDYFSYTYDLGGTKNSPTDVADSTITANTFETGTLSAPPHAVCDLAVRGSNAGGSSASMSVFVRPIPGGSMAVGASPSGTTSVDIHTLGFLMTTIREPQ